MAALKRANGIIGDEEYEDDGNYGSSATIDVEVLQAISKRVHYGKLQLLLHPILLPPVSIGKFVSESKFTENPSLFVPHILKPDRAALEALITKPEVEGNLLLRLRKKAATYAQDFASDGGQSNGALKIDVDGVVELYESYIIPLTKEVEVGLVYVSSLLDSKQVLKVDYLLQRLDGMTQEEIDRLASRSS